MDLARIVELLGSQTEGDPNFQSTEESQFYVEMLRLDDVQRRADQQTFSETPPEHDPEAQTHDQEELAGSLIEEPNDTVTEPVATPVDSVAPTADPLPALVTEGDDAQPIDLLQEQGDDASPAAATQESGDEASPSATPDTPGQSSELPDILTDSGDEAVPNQRLREEGMLVAETPTTNGNTTMIVPESLQAAGFDDVLRHFDVTVKLPDVEIGELPMLPELEETDTDIVTTTEHAEQMIAGLSQSLLQWERNV